MWHVWENLALLPPSLPPIFSGSSLPPIRGFYSISGPLTVPVLHLLLLLLHLMEIQRSGEQNVEITYFVLTLQAVYFNILCPRSTCSLGNNRISMYIYSPILQWKQFK